MRYDAMCVEKAGMSRRDRVHFQGMIVLAILVHIGILYAYVPRSLLGTRTKNGLTPCDIPFDVIRLPREKQPVAENREVKKSRVERVSVKPAQSPEDTIIATPMEFDYQIAGYEDFVFEPPPPQIEPVRPGGEVIAPKLIRSTPPVYPPLAVKMGIQGMVVIEAVVDRHGVVTSANVIKSLYGILDEAALEAVRSYVYEPGTLNGVPLDVLMVVTVQFVINR